MAVTIETRLPDELLPRLRRCVRGTLFDSKFQLRTAPTHQQLYNSHQIYKVCVLCLPNFIASVPSVASTPLVETMGFHQFWKLAYRATTFLTSIVNFLRHLIRGIVAARPTLFPWQRKHQDIIEPLCRCDTDQDIASKRLEMHPLFAASFHNQICAPLCGLPEELLLDIMLLLDPLSVECLRRINRLFSRIFLSPALKHYQNTNKIGRVCPSIWALSSAHLEAPLSTAALHSALQRDRINHLCSSGRDIHARGRWTKKYSALTCRHLHCSGCDLDHTALAFSARQRRAPAYARKCIGYEGSVRLCEHNTVGSCLKGQKSARQTQIRQDGDY